MKHCCQFVKIKKYMSSVRDINKKFRKNNFLKNY